MDMLKAERLTISYGQAPAVRDVSLALAPGQIAGLIGFTGSGKTTLARALAGVLPEAATITAGRVERSGRTAYIPQEPSQWFSPYLTLGSQIADLGAPDPVALLERCGVSEASRLSRSYLHQVSGGELQRAAWAQALAVEPQWIVADEPTTALDVRLEAELARLMRVECAQRNVGALWLSHNLKLLRSVAQQLLILHAGELVENGPLEGVLCEPSHAITAAHLEAWL